MGEGNRDLRELGACWAREAAEDLSGLSGVGLELAAHEIESGERSTLLPRTKGALVSSRCDVQGESSASVWFVLPVQAAQVLAALSAGKGADEFEAYAQAPFEGEVSEAYRGSIELCAGILGRVLAEEAELPSLQLADSSVASSASELEEPAAGSYVRARFSLEAEGFPKETVDLFVGQDLAAEWFGLAVAANATEPGSSALEKPVYLVDPCPESRDVFARLVEELGARVVGVDPEDLTGDAFDDLFDASWVVATWDLGGRSGMDLVERMRGADPDAAPAIALACEEPTRAMVEAALRWGARTVLCQPWDGDEIRARLLEG